MNMPTLPSRPIIFRTILAALGCAMTLAFAGVTQSRAADVTALRPLDDKAPSLPLTASFQKVADADTGPYVLSLKNTSEAKLKVTAKILLSVYFHADSKSRNLPEQTIEAGQVWTIPNLAANDKVTITAAGFSPLELTVP